MGGEVGGDFCKRVLIVELAKTILSGIMLFASFFAIVYLLDFYILRKKTANISSVKVGLIVAAIDFTIFLIFKSLFPDDLEQKGLPGWYPVREGWGLKAFFIIEIIGALLIYLFPVYIVRRILSKPVK